MIERIKALTAELNKYRDAYYNNNTSLISDYEYDLKFKELRKLESEANYREANSPTITVGYEVCTELTKVTHAEPLLSLDDTQDIEKFTKFCSRSNVLLMHKLDGLTVDITYEDGKLVQAATRGDGEVGQNITHNIKVLSCVPKTIPFNGIRRITGELIITKQQFEAINAKLPEGSKYRNPRNLVSGTACKLDSAVCAERAPLFICWNANSLTIDGKMKTGFDKAAYCGFKVVDYIVTDEVNSEILSAHINNLKTSADTDGIPIDGIVAVYNDIEFGKSLGRTAHHFNNGYAFKFYDECEPTTLRDVCWTMGKTGVLTPTAVFDPVELEGTTVSRASLHNVSIIKSLKLGIGDNITVYKANQIIPQVRQNLTESNSLEIPNTCPECGSPAAIKVTIDKDRLVKILCTNPNRRVEVLYCTNPNCKARMLKLLAHFVSKSAMNIIGLSEATLTQFMDLGIVNTFSDIYNLKNHINVLQTLEGFGYTSITKLLESIEVSRTTTVQKLLTALSIPSVGKSVAKLLAGAIGHNPSRIFELSTMNLTAIESIGDIMQEDIRNWFNCDKNVTELRKLLEIVNIENTTVTKSSNVLSGKKFVITGKLTNFSNRNELVSAIENAGGSVQSSVSSSTTYLINNDINSTTGKNKTAKDLGIPIISEDEIIKMLGDTLTELKPVTKSVPAKPSPRKLF